MSQVQPFLMFKGNAADAIAFYLNTFDKAEILSMKTYDKKEASEVGTIKHASIRIHDQIIQCIDSVVAHNFSFTPSISMFVQFDTEAELDRVYQAMQTEAETLMPLDQYPFSPKYTWLNDKFGVSWQLSLAKN